MKNSNNFEIIGRVQNGTKVTHYVLRDNKSGLVEVLDKESVEQLAVDKGIINCKAQNYKDKITLKGIGCKLSQLPRYDEHGHIIIERKTYNEKTIADFKLIGKIFNGRAISEYVLAPLNGQEIMRVTKDLVLELAESGRIQNVYTQTNKGEKMLRGKYGLNLENISVYK